MSAYKTTGYIETAEWKGKAQGIGVQDKPLAVGLVVAIPAADFTGLDLTRPITITQEDS